MNTDTEDRFLRALTEIDADLENVDSTLEEICRGIAEASRRQTRATIAAGLLDRVILPVDSERLETLRRAVDAIVDEVVE